MMELKVRCEAFVKGRDAVKQAFPFQPSYYHPLCAAVAMARGHQVDSGKMQACKKLIQRETGAFSQFRGTAALALVGMLAQAERPEEQLALVQQAYQVLRGHLRSSEYLPVAAFVMTDTVSPAEYEHTAACAGEIYRGMRSAHPFLTGNDDQTAALLLAMSPRGAQVVLEDMEACYDQLADAIGKGNGTQALAQQLALYPQGSEVKCRRALELRQMLADQRLRVRELSLAVLGALAMADVPLKILAEETVWVEHFLRTQKGFGAMGVGGEQRLLYAMLMVIVHHQADLSAVSAAGNAAVSAAVAAQITALNAVMLCTLVVSASAVNAAN